MTIGALPETMKAVMLEAPFKVAIRDIPTPTIEKPTDVVIQTTVAGLCGSDLHMYRGHIPVPFPISIGHEVVGKIVLVGDAVTKWKVGDNVIVPFTVTCGEFEPGVQDRQQAIAAVAQTHGNLKHAPQPNATHQ